MFDWLTGGLGSVIGGLFSGGGAAAAAAEQAKAQQAINAQNLAEQQREFGINESFQQQQFSASQGLAQQLIGLQTEGASGGFMAPQAQNIVNASRILGVNPITMAGGLGSAGPSFSASVGGGGAISGGNAGLSAASRSALGEGLKNFGAGLTSALENVSKTDELKTQLMQLQIDSTKADVIHKNLLNSALALKTQPGIPRGNGVPLPRSDPRFDETIPAYTKVISDSGTVVIPSKGVTERTFSAIPGLPGSAVIAKDVLNQIPTPPIFRPDFSRQLEDVGPIGNPMGDNF